MTATFKWPIASVQTKKMQICPLNLNLVLLFLRNSKATYWRSNAWTSRRANRNRDRYSCKTYNEKEKFRKLFKSPFGQILKSAGSLHYPPSLLTYLSPALVSLAQVTSLFSIRLPWLYYYLRNFCHLIGWEQRYFSLIWNTYMWKLQLLW